MTTASDQTELIGRAPVFEPLAGHVERTPDALLERARAFADELARRPPARSRRSSNDDRPSWTQSSACLRSNSHTASNPIILLKSMKSAIATGLPTDERVCSTWP